MAERKPMKKVNYKEEPSVLETTVHDVIKEKAYATKQVDTSIAILDSPEEDVVLEALLFLSKYADIHLNNLNYLQQQGLMNKLLDLFDRNICILRLSLRLMGILLTLDDVVAELDQEKYDDKILKIANMYVSHTDPYVRQFCVSTLSKFAGSGRINCLIFKTDLFNPILDTIQNTKDAVLLEWTLELLLKLLSAPAAVGILPEIYTFEITILMMHLDSKEERIAQLSYEVIKKLTFYCLNVFQIMFREAKLIENMLSVVMNRELKEFHQAAFEIIHNSLPSEETSDYFIESLEFLKFCQWVKRCDDEYMYPSIVILEHLTKIPHRRQILFDLSVEDSILYCLRSSQKKVLNKTCLAISNMTTHSYCCEQMLTPPVLKELFQILLRKDEEDPGNEIALKTISDFSRRHIATTDMIHSIGGHKTLLMYFKRGIGFISEESFLTVMEVLYRMSMHPLHQQEIVSASFFRKTPESFPNSTYRHSHFCLRDNNELYRQIFLSLNGPLIFVGTLQTYKSVKLLKNSLLFIHSILPYESVAKHFIQCNLVAVLKDFSQLTKLQVPITTKMLKLVYNLHLPLKFFEINKLDIIDKIGNRFYIINGQWTSAFPFLEILEATQVSTINTIYIVDYSFEFSKYAEEEDSLFSGSFVVAEKKSSERTVSTISRVSSSLSSSFRRGPFQINYGKISPDPFLPRYIYRYSNNIDPSDKIEAKAKALAEFIDIIMCGPNDLLSIVDKMHTFKIHIQSLKHRLGTSLIPIGYLRMGFHCERALLFKAIADRCFIPSTFVKGRNKNNVYWNEIAVLDVEDKKTTLKVYVVDLVNNPGELLLVGTRAANQYCNLEA
ncbi:hypothetical protein NQ315_008562 [Exocentrus adspersus]|uniref:EDR1/CTR1/ARMC3-like peptidase-like domain-containing protein n=1 Tax=Exocentrus adspersus TaxID=1586481 RepID=A0AAV8W651_9CUCU|nr:hypothetical protein NQ315_008562 [Exocentrus adspersus]